MMDGANLFLIMIAALSLLYSAYNGASVARHRENMAYTTGTVVSLWGPMPETVKKNNSKWAVVSYQADGCSYTSKKRIQVPMYCRIGSVVKVCYNKEKPEELYIFSIRKGLISLAMAAICILAVVWRSID